VYQAVPYVGMAKVFDFIVAVNAVLLKGVDKDLGEPDSGEQAQPVTTT